MELTILLNGIQIITMNKSEIKIAIIGLGYVGFPLVVEFAKKYKVIGFDIDQNRIEELEKNNNSTL